MEITRTSFEDLQSIYNIDHASLNSHLENMVIQPDGFHNVNIDEDKEIADMMQRIIYCAFGKGAMNCFVLSGSVAQGLKCEKFGNRGDIDIELISDYPEITVDEQGEYLAEQSEPGFFRVKIRPTCSKFPVVQRNGEFYLSASSLRKLESVWWPSGIRTALAIIYKQQAVYHMFNEYEKSSDGAANSIKWKTTREENYTIEADKIYFEVFRESYRRNIMPLLPELIKRGTERALKLFANILNLGRIYTTIDILTERDNISNMEAEIDDCGIIIRAMEYAINEISPRSPAQIVDPGLLGCFEMICHYFANIIDSKIKVDGIGKQQKEEIINAGFIDLVPSIKCQGFPSTIAADWTKRVASKNWPDKSIVTKVVHGGFHLVAKTFESEDRDVDVDFRISFNFAGTTLAQSLSRFQKECFRVFKMYYYEHLQSGNEILKTYHLKTIFFWMLEKTDPDLWCEENRALIFYLLMHQLICHLKDRQLPHYFIPRNNLFRYRERKDLDDLAQKVESVLKDPISKVGEKIQEVMEYYKCKNKARKENRDPFLDVNDIDLVREQNPFRVQTITALKNVAADSAVKRSEFEIQGVMLKTEEVNAILTDKRAMSILEFCFDIIYAKHVALAKDYSSKSNREKFMFSPFSIFMCFALPVSDSILKGVFCRHLDKSNKIVKKIKEVEQIINVASILWKGSNDDNSDWIDIAFQLIGAFSVKRKPTAENKKIVDDMDVD